MRLSAADLDVADHAGHRACAAAAGDRGGALRAGVARWSRPARRSRRSRRTLVALVVLGEPEVHHRLAQRPSHGELPWSIVVNRAGRAIADRSYRSDGREPRIARPDTQVCRPVGAPRPRGRRSCRRRSSRPPGGRRGCRPPPRAAGRTPRGVGAERGDGHDAAQVQGRALAATASASGARLAGRTPPRPVVVVEADLDAAPAAADRRRARPRSSAATSLARSTECTTSA